MSFYALLLRKEGGSKYGLIKRYLGTLFVFGSSSAIFYIFGFLHLFLPFFLLFDGGTNLYISKEEFQR